MSDPKAGLPIGTVEQILERAPKDLKTEVVPIPEWDCSLRLRSLSAAQSAEVRQVSLDISGDSPDVAWAAMERRQFLEGVLEPKFDESQVAQLHKSSGRGFARVIAWLDANSGTNKEELRKAQHEFREPEE